jgi:hypothetical protein
VSFTNVAGKINDGHHPCNALFNSITPLRKEFCSFFKKGIAIGWF